MMTAEAPRSSSRRKSRPSVNGTPSVVIRPALTVAAFRRSGPLGCTTVTDWGPITMAPNELNAVLRAR
jgi:hypothetical protein